MRTVVKTTDSENIDQKVIDEAAAILKKGGLVAFPTETVYGLGANGLDSNACRKIYEAKGRPSDNPLILHIGEIEQLEEIADDIPDCAEQLMDAFWPGPITIIFKKKSIVPDSVTGNFGTVAVRFPSNKIARSLINAAGVPIAAPSANTSGKPSPTRASHVLFDMDGKIDMIIDGGPTRFGLESTIIDVSTDVPTILRPGAITSEMIETVIGYVEIDPAVRGGAVKTAPRAPGMKYTHYSPNARVILVKGEDEKVVEEINRLVEEQKSLGLKAGVMTTDENKDKYNNADAVLSLGSRTDDEQIGANLFKMLRKFDFLGIDVVYSEVFDESGEGSAIMNRLRKAAGNSFIEVK